MNDNIRTELVTILGLICHTRFGVDVRQKANDLIIIFRPFRDRDEYYRLVLPLEESHKGMTMAEIVEYELMEYNVVPTWPWYETCSRDRQTPVCVGEFLQLAGNSTNRHPLEVTNSQAGRMTKPSM